MIELAFNSTLKLKRFVRNNNDGSKEFADEVTVPCYREDKEQKVLSANGNEVTSKTNYYTTEKITNDDIVDDNQILNVDYYSMFGFSYYRSYT